ncbi:hypothetical protein MJ575_20165 [Klebsiella pneumoniae]|nr:hypothetical protein MJ575_20165 [Klebsiella pneumoniae]
MVDVSRDPRWGRAFRRGSGKTPI